MSYLEAILMGLIQGLTEFLPVSSSGHITLYSLFLGIKDNIMAFNIAVHLGTLVAVVYVYRKIIFEILGGLIAKQKDQAIKLVACVLVATVPTAVIGLLVKKYLLAYITTNIWIAIFLFITGLILYFGFGKANIKNTMPKLSVAVKELTVKKAFLIGLVQGCAVLPGISRSGSTIVAGYTLGLSPAVASMFSFLLSIPAIAGAAVLEFGEASFPKETIGLMALGALSAFIFGLVGLKLTLYLVQKNHLRFFSYYLWSVSLLILGLSIG